MFGVSTRNNQDKVVNGEGKSNQQVATLNRE